MFIENALYFFPIWISVACALLPPMVVIIGIRLFRRREITNRATLTTRGTLQALLSTAFVFSVTFSVNQLWSQNSKIYEAATEVAQSGVDLVDAVDQVDPLAADALTTQFTLFLEAADRDSLDIALSGATAATDILKDIRAELSELPADSDQAKAIDTAYESVHSARRAWIAALNAPGIPDVIWINIIVLGLVFAGVIAASPPGNYPRYETEIVALAGIVIGFFQIPLYVLNSREYVQTLTRDIFRNSPTITPRPWGSSPVQGASLR